MAKNKKDVKQVVQKEYPEFVDAVQSLTTVELEMKISDYAKHQEEIVTAKENDEELTQISERKSELEAPYRDAKKANNLKMRYLIALLKDKGGNA